MRSELFWTAPCNMLDDPRAWDSERMYFTGLASDGGETVDMLKTPSGAAAAPQAAQPSATSGGWLDSLIKGVSQALPVAAQAYTVKKLTDVNIDRARQGLQPLSAQQYQAMIPAAQVQVGPDDAAKKLMLYGALGVGGILLLRALKVI
jgi:hypothetical protein